MPCDTASITDNTNRIARYVYYKGEYHLMSRSQVSQIPFPATETCAALRTAALDARQARARYQQAAALCESVGAPVIAHAFRFTAAQEKEHAAIFEGLLEVWGEQPPPPPTAEPQLPADPAALLEAAARAEEQSGCIAAPAAAHIALQEGYPRIATAFSRIAETERLHAQRFARYALALSDGSLFRDAYRVGWLCLPCGQLSYGTDAPETCAACGAPRGFIRSSFHPFAALGE